MNTLKTLIGICTLVIAFTSTALVGDPQPCLLPLPCAPDPVIRPATYIQQHIAVNNVWYSYTDGLCPHGGQNGVVNITGHWLCAGGASGALCPGPGWYPGCSLEDGCDPVPTQCDKVEHFVGMTQEQLGIRIRTYSNRSSTPSRCTDGILVLDMEHPVHPRNLWKYFPCEDNGDCIDPQEIVEAWKLRIAVVKAEFPNAKIGMYGLLNPHGQGHCGNNHRKRLTALIQAGQWGLYDDLDYLVPVLYNRFGPSDTGGPHPCVNGQNCPNAWDTYADYAERGIHDSYALIDSAADPSSLALLPFLNMRVANGGSCDNGVGVLDLDHPDPIGATILTIVDVLRENGVKEFAIWHGANQQEINSSSQCDDPDPWLISQFFCEAFCTADFNHDGVINQTDEMTFFKLMLQGDMRADLNCDGVLDADDITLFYDYMSNGCPLCFVQHQ